MKNGSAIPVHVDAPSVYHPLHERDILRMLPAFLESASVPATVVNWGGSTAVSIEEWCTYLAELTGLEARFDPTEHTIDSVQLDLTKMHEIAGRTEVDWKQGMRADGGGPTPRVAVELSEGSDGRQVRSARRCWKASRSRRTESV